MQGIRSFDTTYIVVDGLDEFSSDHDRRIELAELLVGLRARVSSKSLRICVTSREMEDILQALSTAERVPVRASAAEIISYLETKISKSAHARRMVKQDPDLLEHMTGIVLKKSDRM